jgi:hypothetical protein
MLYTDVLEDTKSPIFCSVKFIFESRILCEIMWNNMMQAGEATDESMVHTHFMQGTQGYE